MRTFIYIFLLFCSCNSIEKHNRKITIINIGHYDRISIGQQLRIVNSFNPAVIGIDFIVRKDSSDKDSVLRTEFIKANKAVHITHLADYDEDLKYWTSKIQQHEKFRHHHTAGFSNLISHEGKLVKMFSLHEKVKDSIVNAFSFQVAKEAGSIHSKYLANKELYDLEISSDKPYDIISADDLLNRKFDSALIQNRIILFGYAGPGDEDAFVLDNNNEKIYGVEVHARIINQILK